MHLSTKNSSENHTQCTRRSASALTFQHATAEAFAPFSTQVSNRNQPCTAFKPAAAASSLLKLKHNKKCSCSYLEIILKFNKTDNVCVMLQWGTFVQPLLQWKSNKYYTFWVCVSSLRYSAHTAHVPYSHLWPVQLYNIFPHYFINGINFGERKKVTEHKMCFLIFPTTFVWNISHLRRMEHDMIQNVDRSSCRVPEIRVIF
jgi:hypothetical protein